MTQITAAERATAWNRAHPERRKEIKRKWNQANPDYGRRWYIENRDRVLKAVRDNYRQRLETDPHRVRAMNRERAARRRARLRKSFTERVDPQLLWERDEGVCGICGGAVDSSDWHMDHIVPIARGGAHSYANVQVTHPRCNRRKAAS